MTDLTQRQLHDAILRSLKQTGKRMAAKYKGSSPDRAAPKTRARKSGKIGNGRRGRSASTM